MEIAHLWVFSSLKGEDSSSMKHEAWKQVMKSQTVIGYGYMYG